MDNCRPSVTPSDEREGDNVNTGKRVRWNNASGSPAASVEEGSNLDEETGFKIFAAVSGYHGRVGGVYFNPENATLYLMEDTTDSSHFDLIRMFLEQTKVDVCLVSSRADEHLIAFCQEYMELSGGQCQVRPHKEFIPHKGKTRLQQLGLFTRLPQAELDNFGDTVPLGTPRNVNDFVYSRRNVDDPNTPRLYAAIRLLNFGGEEAPLCLSSASALLEQLLRVHATEELDETQNHIGTLRINNIEILSLNQVMQVNADALAVLPSSLQIFDNENHASVHSDRTKEGHSLFQLLNHTSTYLGKSLLRRWCLRPSLSIPTITARHAAIECFTLAENSNNVSTIRSNLRGLCQVPKAMALLRTGRGRLSEWRGVAKFAYHVNLMKDAARELSNRENIGTIDRVSFIIKFSLHTPKSEKLLTALDEVDTEETGALVNMVIDWEESQNNQRVCVNPGIDEALDEKKRVYNGLDDLLDTSSEYQHLQDGQPARTSNKFQGGTFREIEIMEETLTRVLKHDEAIIAVCEAAAEVDCLLSLSFASWLHNWVKPEMTEDNVLEIRGGIHPLQSLLVPTFVPNDAYIVGGLGIGLQSAFMNDLAQVSLALRNCTARSLIILDEFGKGSLSTDGAGLFAGVIKQLLGQGSSCPKVFASTHFHELFTRGLIPPELPISYAFMKVLLNNNVVQEEQRQNEITYLYKVAPGLCLDSYAAQCATMYGINKSVVERARFVSTILSHNEIGVLLDEDMPQEQKEELEVRAAICQRFIAWKMSVDDDVGVKDRLREVLGE
ncbi:hypothetical protein OPQ81_010896 [Rhizoctonia solani]|nr:hypothetical protein OPQ81_010896 [Rhizoctonia solani]